MNLRKFERLMKDRQPNWDIQSTRINQINHVLDIRLSYIGTPPSKLIRAFKFLRLRWLKRRVDTFTASAQEIAPALRPRVKQIQLYVG